MAKIIFAGAGEVLVCRKCGGELDPMDAGSEDGQLDSYFCDSCTAFVDVRVKKIGDKND